MYLSSWPTLSPVDLLRREPSDEAPPFPFDAPSRIHTHRARDAIYYLLRGLEPADGRPILVPDYHHGSEVRAIQAAGGRVVFYPIRRNLEPDMAALVSLCESRPRALLVIHYLGWPQPIEEIARICAARGIPLIEDCALALLSETGGRPLGSFGDYSVFCLYKTLPLPDGGLLVQNRTLLASLASLDERRCGRAAVTGRILELTIEWTRSRVDAPGRALIGAKRAAGRALRRLGFAPVPPGGDIDFDGASSATGISDFSTKRLGCFDYQAIRRRRRRNYLRLRERLSGRATLLDRDLENGVCPLFFPLLVADKGAAARALWKRGIGAVEFWNEGIPGCGGTDARFLRRHLLELPVHQDLTERQTDYMADQVIALGLRL